MFLALTESGLRLRLEPGRVPEGTVVPEVVEGRMRARILTGSELPAEGGAWVDHRKSCGKPPPRPRCPWCRGPMDPWLITDGWRGHLGCQPLSETERRASDSQHL